MRLNRSKLRRIIQEQYQQLNEAAQSWKQYIDAGNTPESKEKRKKIKLRWETVGGNKNLYPEDEVKSPASPAKFSGDYKGWTKWYFACIKDPGAMRLINKKPGKHISPDEMLAVYTAMIPANKLDAASKMAKSDSDKKLVDEFMAGLDLGSGGMEQSEIAKLGKTPAEKALDIISQAAEKEEQRRKSGEGSEDLSQTDPDLSKFTDGSDVRAPELKLKPQVDDSGRAKDIEVYTGDPDKDRSSTPGKMPRFRAPDRFRNRKKKKNESTEISRSDLRKLIRESLRGR